MAALPVPGTQLCTTDSHYKQKQGHETYFVEGGICPFETDSHYKKQGQETYLVEGDICPFETDSHYKQKQGQETYLVGGGICPFETDPTTNRNRDKKPTL